MEDNSEFALRVPVILGTLTTEHILNVMTENEITNYQLHGLLSEQALYSEFFVLE